MAHCSSCLRVLYIHSTTKHNKVLQSISMKYILNAFKDRVASLLSALLVFACHCCTAIVGLCSNTRPTSASPLRVHMCSEGCRSVDGCSFVRSVLPAAQNAASFNATQDGLADFEFDMHTLCTQCAITPCSQTAMHAQACLSNPSVVRVGQ
jgi:hypothetical protein